jgi:hypothetical protein
MNIKIYILCLIQIAEFTKEASEKWRNLNGKEKQEFESKAAADKQRYDREVRILKMFFTTQK